MVYIERASFPQNIPILYKIIVDFAKHEQFFDNFFVTIQQMSDLVKDELFIPFLAWSDERSIEGYQDRASGKQLMEGHWGWSDEATGRFLVGYSAVFPSYDLTQRCWFLFLEHLFVSPGWRGRRIGKQLLAHAARYAIAHGMVEMQFKMSANTNPDFSDSLAFYERLGSREFCDYAGYILEQDRLIEIADEVITNETRVKKVQSSDDVVQCVKLMCSDHGEECNSGWKISVVELEALLAERQIGCYLLLGNSSDGSDPAELPKHAEKHSGVSAAAHGCYPETYLSRTNDGGNDDDDAFGYVFCTVEGDGFFGKTMAIAALYIAPSHRRHGYGINFLKQLARIVLNDGFTQLVAWKVPVADGRARKFLEKLSPVDSIKLGLRDFRFDEPSLNNLAKTDL